MGYTAMAVTGSDGNRLVSGWDLGSLRVEEDLGRESPVDGMVDYETRVYTVSELLGGFNGVSRPNRLPRNASCPQYEQWRQEDALYRAHLRYNLLLTRMMHEGVVGLSCEVRVGRSEGRLSAVTVVSSGVEYRMFGNTYYGRYRVTEVES